MKTMKGRFVAWILPEILDQIEEMARETRFIQSEGVEYPSSGPRTPDFNSGYISETSLKARSRAERKSFSKTAKAFGSTFLQNASRIFIRYFNALISKWKTGVSWIALISVFSAFAMISLLGVDFQGEVQLPSTLKDSITEVGL